MIGALNGLTSLEQLRLDEGCLQFMQSEVFQPVKNTLAYLNFRICHHEMKSHPLLFKNLRKLKFLHMGCNGIDSIDPRMYEFLISLRHLELTPCSIKQIKP
jgi:Leucine-rich repeat (LRR) protein